FPWGGRPNRAKSPPPHFFWPATTVPISPGNGSRRMEACSPAEVESGERGQALSFAALAAVSRHIRLAAGLGGGRARECYWPSDIRAKNCSWTFAPALTRIWPVFWGGG